MKKRATFLLLLGLAQMTGHGLGIDGLRAAGAVTAASPAPKVFTEVRGYETFSKRFVIVWTDPQGRERRETITPEMYSRLDGPYNRRNVYGAAIAYGPVMPPRLRDPALRAALSGSVLRELGFNPDEMRDVRVEAE
jgi:hypothetical protein